MADLAERQKDTGRRVLFSAQKNEAPFLLEWIAYHKAIGFTDIILFSNDCTDGSETLLDQLAAAGEIEHHHHTPAPGVAPQQNASRIAQESNLLHDGDWVMWLDIDEYFVIHSGDGTLDALFAEAPAFQAFLAAWRIFGDGGNATWPGRQISPAFTQAQAHHDELYPYVKTLFKWSERIAHLDIHRPHFDEHIRPRHYRAISSTGDSVERPFYRSGADRFNRVTTPGDWWKLAQVNHYLLRTPDMFARKRERGRGNRPHEGGNDRHTDRFYSRMNKNEVEDRSILRFEEATTRELARLEGLLGGQAKL